MAVQIVHGYVSLNELKQTLNLDQEIYADDDISRAINAASRLIDEYTGQRFWTEAADATRIVTASSVNRIDFRNPALVSVTTLSSDQDADGTFEYAWPGADFLLRPLNAVYDDVPYTWIDRRSGASKTFPTGEGRIQITGRFGWPSIPAQIVEATRIQASRLLTRTREAPLGVAGLGGLEAGAVRLTARVDPDVEVLLQAFVVRQMVR